MRYYLILRWRNWSKTTKISSSNSSSRKDNWATKRTCKVCAFGVHTSVWVCSCLRAIVRLVRMRLHVCVHASERVRVWSPWVLICVCFVRMLLYVHAKIDYRLQYANEILMNFSTDLASISP